MKEKSQVLETSVPVHPYFCLNHISKGPARESTVSYHAIPCGRAMDHGASPLQGRVKLTLPSAMKKFVIQNAWGFPGWRSG